MDNATADRILFLEKSAQAWRKRALDAEEQLAHLRAGIGTVIAEAKDNIVHPT